MKYEDFSFITLNILLFFILCFFIIYFIFMSKICIFESYNIIYINNNLYEIIVSDRELNNFYKNSSLYIENKKYKYSIDKVNKNIMNNNNVNYSEMFLNIDKTNYKSNDIVKISILNRRERLIYIIKNVFNS